MSAKHTPGPVGVEVGGAHQPTIGRATTENSAILRGIERRKTERALMLDALAQASEFTALVEGFFMLPVDPKTGDGPAAPSDSTVIRAARQLRAAVSKATGERVVSGRPNIAKLQAQCDAFNAANPVGTRVMLQRDLAPLPIKTKTRSVAQVLSGHTSVIWLEGVAGCYALDRVTPITTGAAS